MRKYLQMLMTQAERPAAADDLVRMYSGRKLGVER